MKLIITFLYISTLNFSFGQIKTFDKMERSYAQKHFKLVLFRANKALDNPEFDYSMVPNLYKSMALFQLSKDSRWFKSHPNALQEASKLFLNLKNSPDGVKVFNAHIYEISSLKSDLYALAEKFKQDKENDNFEELSTILKTLFTKVPNIDTDGEKAPQSVPNTEIIAETTEEGQLRLEILTFSKTLLGTPYSYSGQDPKGFDCSGFTGFVFKKQGIDLPRRASEQYEKSKKVKQKNVQKGDLVFFDSGSGISHVGLIISEVNEPLIMVHASSSKGVIITEIEKSDYWLSRLSGFGTYVN